MNMQLKNYYGELQVGQEDSWNVNLLTILSKLAMALVMISLVMIVSMMA